MDYMTLKEASEKWGVSIRQINYEEGYNLADPERRKKAYGYENKARKGIKT